MNQKKQYIALLLLIVAMLTACTPAGEATEPVKSTTEPVTEQTADTAPTATEEIAFDPVSTEPVEENTEFIETTLPAEETQPTEASETTDAVTATEPAETEETEKDNGGNNLPDDEF